MASEVRSLTGLRGVAALYVVLYHFTQGTPGDTPLGAMLGHGYLAVDLFFVLSGFVLAMVHGRDTFDARGYGRFLLKRFARVYPLYATLTLATIAVAAAEGSAAYSPGRLLVNVALVQGWGVGASIVAPAWSLSAELAAYLLFPLLCAALLWGPRGQAAALGLAALLLLAFVSEHSDIPRTGPLDLYQSNTVAPLIRCLCEFALGLLALRASQTRAMQRLLHPWASTALAAAILGLLLLPGSDLAVVLLLGPFVAALAAGQDGVVGRLLASGPVVWLGTVSFSIYLSHFLLRELIRDPLAAWLAAARCPQPNACADAVACAAVLLAAQLLFHGIEKPARTMFRTGLKPAATLL